MKRINNNIDLRKLMTFTIMRESITIRVLINFTLEKSVGLGLTGLQKF